MVAPIWDKVFKGREWLSWHKFKKNIDVLGIKIKKEKNIGLFDYDRILVRSKDLSIYLEKYDEKNDMELIKVDEKKIGKIIDDDIDKSKEEIKSVIGG